MVDITAILSTLTKGLGIVNQIIGAKAIPAVTVLQNALPVVVALTELATAAQAGEVTDEQLTATETILDANLDAFNAG